MVFVNAILGKPNYSSLFKISLEFSTKDFKQSNVILLDFAKALHVPSRTNVSCSRYGNMTYKVLSTGG